MKRHSIYGIIAGVMLCWMFNSTMAAQSLTADEILARCEQNYSKVEDYVVDVVAELDMERVRIPKMTAVMYYKSPDKVHFESPNFALLPREGFGMPVATLIARYVSSLKGVEEIDMTPSYRLQLVAKDPSERLQQLFVWIDKGRFSLTRMETVPYQGRSVKISFSYARIGNEYLLPDTMRIEMAIAQQDTSDRSSFLNPAEPTPQEMRRPPRSGSMKVTFLNYRVNTGLSDDLFKPKEFEN